MKKVLIYLPNLHPGGAEAVMKSIANNLVENNYEVTFVFVKREGVLIKELNAKIIQIDLNLKSQWLAPLKLPFLIKKINPDFIFSSIKESNFIAILSKIIAFSDAKNIIREANTVSQEIKAESKLVQKIKNKVVFYFYRYANHIVFLSDRMKEDAINSIPNLKVLNTSVIGNPVNFKKVKKFSLEKFDNYHLFDGKPFILSVGRLHHQKNYFFLLEALASYKSLYGEFTLLVLGEGSLKDQLKKRTESLGLKNNVFFIGYEANPFKYMARADVFVMPSLFEGMSNSLIQAISLGANVLVSDSQSTSIDSIRNYNRGYSYTANNIKEFCAQLNLAIENQGNNISGYDLSQFDDRIIMKKYLRLFSLGG